MELNLNKRNEIVMGPPSNIRHLPPLQFPAAQIERVNSVRLLGINLNSDFSWKSHIEAITSKATQRIYFFFKQLNGRSPIQPAPFLHWGNQACVGIRCPSLDHLLSKTQIDQIKAIQRRALRIIYSYTNDMPYINALYCASIPSLVDRRE